MHGLVLLTLKSLPIPSDQNLITDPDRSPTYFLWDLAHWLSLPLTIERAPMKDSSEDLRKKNVQISVEMRKLFELFLH